MALGCERLECGTALERSAVLAWQHAVGVKRRRGEHFGLVRVRNDEGSEFAGERPSCLRGRRKPGQLFASDQVVDDALVPVDAAPHPVVQPPGGAQEAAEMAEPRAGERRPCLLARGRRVRPLLTRPDRGERVVDDVRRSFRDRVERDVQRESTSGYVGGVARGDRLRRLQRGDERGVERGGVAFEQLVGDLLHAGDDGREVRHR